MCCSNCSKILSKLSLLKTEIDSTVTVMRFLIQVEDAAGKLLDVIYMLISSN
jgi:hypothetical protein